MAPEWYDNIPNHPSWPMVIVNFVRDSEVGINARAKRLAKGAGLSAGIPGKTCAKEEGDEDEDEDVTLESDKSE